MANPSTSGMLSILVVYKVRKKPVTYYTTDILGLFLNTVQPTVKITEHEPILNNSKSHGHFDRSWSTRQKALN